MTDEQKPSLEVFTKAITSGHFDDHLTEIENNLMQRREFIKEELLKRVREVFGADARIVDSKTAELGMEAQGARENPFIEKTRKPPIIMDQESSENNLDRLEKRANTEPLPGPYREDPRDGNAYRVKSEVAELVVITDMFGGHEATISKDAWDAWTPVDEKPSVEQQINQGIGTTIEHRGAIIGGVSSSDIE